MPETAARTAQRCAHRTLLSVRYLPVEQLKLAPRNARVHTKKHVRQIAASLENFGRNRVTWFEDEVAALAEASGGKRHEQV
jgi:hypothetical protein